MINSVKRVKGGKYMVNDCVVVSNINVNNNGELVCSFDFDENEITEEKAEFLAYEMISQSFENSTQ
jgi:hypothetical protein